MQIRFENVKVCDTYEGLDVKKIMKKMKEEGIKLNNGKLRFEDVQYVNNTKLMFEGI